MMFWKEFTIELLKILFGAPLVTGSVVAVILILFRKDIRELMSRIATLRFPGGELTTSQAQRTAAEEALPEEPPLSPQQPPELPGGLTLTPRDQERLVELLKAERARA